MFAFIPFVLSLNSNLIDFSILSITTEKGMRSLFRISVNESEFLLHILWHFNWPTPEPIPTAELKEQLDDVKLTFSEGRMKPVPVQGVISKHKLPQNSSTVPMPKVKPPRKKRS